MIQRDERPTLVLLCSDPEAAAALVGLDRVFSTDEVRKYGAVRIDGEDAGFWWVASTEKNTRAPGVVTLLASDARFAVDDGVKTLTFEHVDPSKAAAVALGAWPGATTLQVVKHGDTWTATAVGRA